MTRRQHAVSASHSFVSRELTWCCAFGSLLYSILIPLMALESGLLAEKLLQFTFLQQVLHFALTILCTIHVISETMLTGWKPRHSVTCLAALSLLISIGPQSRCCSVLVSAISGSCPLVEVGLPEVLWHITPMAGCIWVLIEFGQRQGR